MTRAEAMEFLKFNHDRANKTIDVQWKVNISFWTIIALGIYHHELIAGKLDSFWTLFVCIGFAFCHLGYLLMTQLSHEKSRLVEAKITKQLNMSTDEYRNFKIEPKQWLTTLRFRCIGWMWVLVQVAWTVLMLIVFYHVIQTK